MSRSHCTRRDFLKVAGLGAVSVAVPGCANLASRSGDRAAQNKPNIIFILADDLGWAELGCYGNGFNETPHLDRLAAKGVRFTQAYASAPVCSPYRASLMTGQYPARVGMTNYLQPDDTNHLSTHYTTVAEMLKSAGYATGIIGKWHLTGYASSGVKEFPPAVHGFDETIVSESHGIAGGSYFHPYHFNPDIARRLPDREFLTDRQNLEAVEFIERHRSHPFFLYLSHYAVHTRLVGKPQLVEKYSQKPGAGRGKKAPRNNVHLAAQLESIDEGVGMIIEKLEQLGLAENTILFFTSDNGGESRVTTNAPLREGKSTLYEGGIRVPLIVRLPGVTPRGAVCDAPVCVIDFYPTFCRIAGVNPKPGQCLDGISILPLLRNPNASLARDTLYWHYPLVKPHFLGGRSCGAIRKGDWKLLEFFDDGRLELYNLKEDMGEKGNLAEKMPAKTRELHQLLRQWRKSIKAPFAGGPNLRYSNHLNE
ncbi:MAG: sulfatase-like hydrolase/transferase [Planctomycetota bacterium]|jgi:arylsulfatase A-like enzyme